MHLWTNLTPFTLQGEPQSAWATGADSLEYKAVSGGDGVRMADGTYVYSFNGYVPNDDEQQPRHRRK